MKFSPEQERALEAVNEWIKKPKTTEEDRIFRLFGYAGTGKTTLANHFAEGVSGTTLFAAFTGKAAQAMRAKGARGATTIHSLIYTPKGDKPKKDEKTGETIMEPDFRLNRQSPLADAALLVVDECSMVDDKLKKHLLGFEKPILVLGDPGQLPPVSGGGAFTEAEPDFLLEEIHRQARDNPIIELARRVREGEEIQFGEYKHEDETVRIVRKGEIDSEEVSSADQVLVGTNRTRRRYNARLREIKGFDSHLPQAGDRLVCLRNDNKKGLLNGSMWEVRSAPPSVKASISLLIRSDEEGIEKMLANVKLLKAVFEERGEEIPWQMKKRHDDFDYGYALTVHKAQGSQWNDVVLFDESRAFREHRTRWLYTAITRAARNLTIVR